MKFGQFIQSIWTQKDLWHCGETLLAKNVLEGKTKGYRNHPQLDRFKQTDYPTDRINQYLATVYNEALTRNYNFDKEKLTGVLSLQH